MSQYLNLLTDMMYTLLFTAGEWPSFAIQFKSIQNYQLYNGGINSNVVPESQTLRKLSSWSVSPNNTNNQVMDSSQRSNEGYRHWTSEMFGFRQIVILRSGNKSSNKEKLLYSIVLNHCFRQFRHSAYKINVDL